jgi:hypothetical protein
LVALSYNIYGLSLGVKRDFQNVFLGHEVEAWFRLTPRTNW